MVGPNDDGELGASKEMGPMTESFDNCKKFAIMNLVVLLCRGEGFRVITNGSQFLGVGRVSLPKDCS